METHNYRSSRESVTQNNRVTNCADKCHRAPKVAVKRGRFWSFQTSTPTIIFSAQPSARTPALLLSVSGQVALPESLIVKQPQFTRFKCPSPTISVPYCLEKPRLWMPIDRCTKQKEKHIDCTRPKTDHQSLVAKKFITHSCIFYYLVLFAHCVKSTNDCKIKSTITRSYVPPVYLS